MSTKGNWGESDNHPGYEPYEKIQRCISQLPRRKNPLLSGQGQIPLEGKEGVKMAASGENPPHQTHLGKERFGIDRGEGGYKKGVWWSEQR